MAASCSGLGGAPFLLSTRSLEKSSAASATGLRHLPSLLHLELCLVGQSLAWAKSRSGDVNMVQVLSVLWEELAARSQCPV